MKRLSHDLKKEGRIALRVWNQLAEEKLTQESETGAALAMVPGARFVRLADSTRQQWGKDPFGGQFPREHQLRPGR